MKNKGFTLVELLATIVIISLLAGIATISYTAIVHQSTDKSFESYENTLHAEAVYKLTMYPDDVVFSEGKARLSIADLKAEEINNPIDSDDKCLNSYVEVTKSRVNGVLSMHYKVCLICRNYNSDGSKCRDFEN